VSLLERLQDDEVDARVRHVHEVVDREAGKRDRVLDGRVLQGDGRHLSNDFLRAIERGGIRQLRERDEVDLVLGRHEAGRRALECHVGQADQAHIDHHRDRRNAQHAADAGRICVGASSERRVEEAEEPAEQAIDDPLHAIFRCAVRLQQQRRESRTKGQRVERRDDRRDRDGHGELPVELAGQAADERRRHEHRAQNERDRDDRARHLSHRELRRFERWLPHFYVALHILHDHDRIVDDDADGEDETEQRQGVEREA
jgi:hypothetical protein